MEAEMRGFVEHETDFFSSEWLMNTQAFANGCEPLYQSHHTTVEDVEDDDAPGWYAKDYNPADVAHILRKSQTIFETLKDSSEGKNQNLWAPFEDGDEGELA